MSYAQVPLWPEQASTLAAEVDALTIFMLIVTGAAGLLVAVLVITFAVKYRRRVEGERTARILGSLRLELFWTITPLLIFMVFFVWGARVYMAVARPPQGPMEEVFVVGKQWMWKVQHPDGQREINELHLARGRPVKITVTSEDVIHDFGVPAFRLKVDAVPGRYLQVWYHPTKTGRFHIFCSEYCGVGHAQMIGAVVVQEPWEYEAWLNSRADGSLAEKGRQLFLKLQCVTCHSSTSLARAPVLEGLYGQTVTLADGRTALADEAYLRESILVPRAKVVQGWEPIMPTFKGQASEEELIQLIAYLRTLGPGQTPVRNEDFPPPLGAPTTPEEPRAKP